MAAMIREALDVARELLDALRDLTAELRRARDREAR
jgi:hypothetical protein